MQNQQTLDLPHLSTLIDNPYLVVVVLVMGVVLCREIIALPNNFIAWINFSEPILGRAVNNVW